MKRQFRRNRLLLIGALCLLAATAACGQADSTSPTTLPDGTSPPSRSTDYPTLLVPTPTPVSRVAINRIWTVSPSLEEQIFRSDQIVRATLLSVSTSTESLPSDPGVAPTYRAVHELRFTVHEYLMGSGSSEIVVVVRDDHTFVSEADARRRAEEQLSQRKTTWDDRESILFLRAGQPDQFGGSSAATRSSSAPSLEFTLTNPVIQAPWDYSIDTLSRAWLPSSNAGSSSTRSPKTDSQAQMFITDGSQSPPPSVSLSDLRSKIAEMETTLAAGAGIEGFLGCIEAKILHARHRQVEPWNPSQLEATIASGLGAGSEVNRFQGFRGDGYDRFRLAGPDADLFLTRAADNDEDPKNGFVNLLSVAKPLPAGVYSRYFPYWESSGSKGSPNEMVAS